MDDFTSTQPLKNLTFLVTRPILQSRNLCGQIESLGGRCILFPTLEIAPLPELSSLSLTATLAATDKVIFTSANAVVPVMPYWPHPRHTTEIFAIGPGTATQLAHFGIHSCLPLNSDFSSEGLLALPALQDIIGQQIVIFSGLGGRTILAEQLEKRQARLRQIAVYQRVCPQVSLMPFIPRWQNITAIISTSSESLNNLWIMAGAMGQPWLRQQNLLVISPRMAQSAVALGFQGKLWVAANASDAAIVKTLLQ